MRKSTAAFGLALASFGVAETQGDFSTRPHEAADGRFQSPVDYTLDRESWLGGQLGEAEAAAPSEPLSEEQTRELVSALNEGGDPHCPAEGASEYRAIVIDSTRPNSQVCLNAAQVGERDGSPAIAFETVLNPAASHLEGFDLRAAFDDTTEEKCQEALTSLADFGSFVIGQTGVLPEGQEVSPLIIGGRECTDYTPEPQRPNPPVN